MSYAVCTLFEGHYHNGVAVLCNSLYRKGFRGSMYAGYKGKLPEWASKAKESTECEWKGCSTMEIEKGFYIHFLPIKTHYHLSNYKPAFMIQLFEGLAENKKGLIYFDPDIVVRCNWSFFENWCGCGVAVVHDIVFNDMPATHPIRQGWADLIRKSNRQTYSQLQSYLNGGFCGLRKAEVEFLFIWKEFIHLAISDYGHLPDKFVSVEKTSLFFLCDQNAFNIAAMCVKVSEIGPEGMDFVPGGRIMSHATGRPKPWIKNFIGSAFKGKPPSSADHAFWAYANYPLTPFKTKTHLKFKQGCLMLASFIGRFYRRY